MLKKINQQQGGNILIISLIMLSLTGIMVAPMVSLVNTGIKTTQVYQTNLKQIYAADSGIQKALWEISNDSNIIHDREHQNFDQTYTYPAFSVNDNSVDVSLTYSWLLSGIIDPNGGVDPHASWLAMDILGEASPSADPTLPGRYTITFTYNAADGTRNKKIDQLGVWLPPGFTYEGSLGGELAANNPTLQQQAIYNGWSLKWTLQPTFSFNQLNPPVAKIWFNYLPGNAVPEAAASWVKSQSNDIGYQWDNALSWYKITATARDARNKTTVIKAIVVDNARLTPSLSLVTYEINPP